MLKKASFTNQTAVITSLDPDYQSVWVNKEFLMTKYAVFTTQDAHNFTAGSLVTINGLYASGTPGSARAMSLSNVKVVSVKSATKFVIEAPSDMDPAGSGAGSGSTGYFYFKGYNYFVNSSGLAVTGTVPWTTGVSLYLSKYEIGDSLGYDLYTANPFVTVHCNDGNLGAYKISYGDTV